MNLYMGKMLIVDLTTNKVSTEPLRQDWHCATTVTR